MTCFILSDKDTSALARAICLLGLAPETSNDPIRTAVGLRSRNLEAWQFENDRLHDQSFHYTLSPALDKMQTINLATAYLHNCNPLPGFDSSIQAEWSRKLILSLALPHIEETKYLYDYLLPRISRIDGYADSWASPVVMNPSIQPNKSVARER